MSCCLSNFSIQNYASMKLIAQTLEKLIALEKKCLFWNKIRLRDNKKYKHLEYEWNKKGDQKIFLKC